MLIHRREEVPAAEMDPRDTLSLYYSFLPPDPGKSQHFLPQASKALRRRKNSFRVTRLAEVLFIGRLFNLASLGGKLQQFWATFFLQYTLNNNFGKKCVGLHFG
jgi:hypothetical protein